MLVQGSIKNRSDLALNLVREEADQSKQVMQKRTKMERKKGLGALMIQEEDSQLTRVTTTENSFYQH